MSNTPVEMKIVPASELKRDHVFEMFGNLYQVDLAVINGSDGVEIQAHLIAQISTPRSFNGRTTIFLNSKTPLSIEA